MVLSIGMATMANKKALFVTSWIMSLDLKHTEASFSPNVTDSLCLRVTQVPRSRDKAIFMLTTTTTTRLITLPPYACEQGKNILYHQIYEEETALKT